MANNNDQQNDEELNALLDSALNDFESQTKTQSKPQTQIQSENKSESVTGTNHVQSSIEQNINDVESDFTKLDQVFAPLINSDPELKEHWEKLTQSCASAGASSTDEEFEKSLKDTLKTISEKAQAISGEDAAPISEEELAKIWTNLGIGDENDELNGSFSNFMPLMTNMMQNLLSKELLYPALKDLIDKYPQWLDDNKDTISADDLKRYTQQLEFMRKVCDEFDQEKQDDSPEVKNERFKRILMTMQKMQQCGSPPTDLIGDVPDFNTSFPPGPCGDSNVQNQQCQIM